MRMIPLFLGLDLGTSAVKAMAIDADDRVVAQASAPLTVQRPQPLWSEQDPDQWWQAAVAAVTALPVATRRAIRGIGLSGQMHGAVLLDASDRVLRPAILWNDGRSAAECVELERREPDARAITGNIAMPGFTAPKLLWIQAHEPEVFARTASVLLPKDYLRLRLTGEKISDMSDAAGTLWLDVARRDWSDRMLAATGLERSHMPALAEGSAPAGRLRADVASELQLDAVVVAGGGGDNAASAVGSGVIAPGQALLSLGTSGVLFVVTDRFRPNPERAAHAFCHALPGRWHQMAVLLSAASAIDWAARIAGFESAANGAPAARDRGLRKDTPLFLPYLSGERTPHNDVHARGVFFGLSASTEPADLMVAAIEGVAHAFTDGMDVLLAAGSELTDISVVGGGSRNTYLLELLASALNRPLTLRSGGELGAAFGAARLGRLAATGADPTSDCPAPAVVETVAPLPRLRDLLQRRRAHFIKLYAHLKPSFTEFGT
jgi:xylulokinase